MVRTQIQLTEAQVKALRRLSAETGDSIADLIRQCVELYLDAKRRPDRRSRIERALGVVGRFSSGIKDVSRHHDRYLSEAFRK